MTRQLPVTEGEWNPETKPKLATATRTIRDHQLPAFSYPKHPKDTRTEPLFYAEQTTEDI